MYISYQVYLIILLFTQSVVEIYFNIDPIIRKIKTF